MLMHGVIVGTPVGDPIEYESVRRTLLGPQRQDKLFLGSVKDNIGHTEGASGAAGLLKTLLMMQKRIIPKQANFVSLSPRIAAPPGDTLSVPKETQTWTTTSGKYVALVNNYGAGGSNAALVVRQHPRSRHDTKTHQAVEDGTRPQSFPFILSSRSAQNLRAYAATLKSFVAAQEEGSADAKLASIAYQLKRRQNPSFDYRVSFTASDLPSLISQLGDVASGSINTEKRTKKLPVVLCFGGQNGECVGLSKEVFDSCTVLRTHLVRVLLNSHPITIP